MQLAIPDVASFPLNEMPTAWLYHPFLSGPLLADPPVTFGAVASRLTVTERDDVELLSYVSVQVLVVPAVSLEIVVVPHSADDCVTPAGSQLKATVTFTLYHPEEHAPPLQVTLQRRGLRSGRWKHENGKRGQRRRQNGFASYELRAAVTI